jgi:hypothetical protein
MSSQQELEKLDTTELAVLCQKIADSPSVYTEQGSVRAFELKLEWRTLQSSPEPALEKEQEKEAQLALLKIRMTEFLANTL